MKKSVYKYPLRVEDFQEVTLPKGSEILCVKTQGGTVCLWALVNTEEEETETVKIRCAGTGHPIEEDVEYIDTVLMFGDSLVFHFFKIR